ncbi:transposase, partial [Lacticaseibacillus sp. BCRC 81376]|uniref:transposase n=1 Tax=Lacticaseibacillus sp. BCRC 81376 TaxID=3036496 RepID=UPI00321FB696
MIMEGFSMPRSKYTAQEKLHILEEFRHSKTSISSFSRQHGLGDRTLQRWQTLYER